MIVILEYRNICNCIPTDQCKKTMQGIDKETGLKSTQGNEALLNRLLIKFRDANRDFISQFEQLMADNKVEDAQRMAHSLKSTAGSLGALEVYSAAMALESACKLASPSIENELQNVRENLTIVLESLDSL